MKYSNKPAARYARNWRAKLCNNCNRGIGHLKEKFLPQAMEYLLR